MEGTSLMQNIKDLIEVDDDILKARDEVTKEISKEIENVSELVRYNTSKVLKAFRESEFAEHHLSGSTGYAYDDVGRDKLESVYSKAFSCEAALVRIQVVSGTHALALALFGVLRPGDLLISVTGRPYDTMTGVIGHHADTSGSLKEHKVMYEEIELQNGRPNFDEISRVVADKKPKVALIQRSRGYSWRSSLSIDDIEKISGCIKRASKDTIVFVDNCYGEFTDSCEPVSCTDVDLMAGSLIKNPGGGISPSGGYVAGKAELVEMAAERLTAPGLGSHCGPSLGFTRQMAQGFFLAPMIVGEAIAGSIFAARFLSRMGYDVSPDYLERRDDIVLGVNMKDKETLFAFTKAVQASSPIDAHVTPVAAPMVGYADDVVMAAGAFTQGSSIELSADAPIRPPYTAYLQGGLNRFQVELAILTFAQSMKNLGKYTWR